MNVRGIVMNMREEYEKDRPEKERETKELKYHVSILNKRLGDMDTVVGRQRAIE